MNNFLLYHTSFNIVTPPDKLKYSDYLLPLELLYCDIKDLDLPNEKE